MYALREGYARSPEVLLLKRNNYSRAAHIGTNPRTQVYIEVIHMRETRCALNVVRQLALKYDDTHTIPNVRSVLFLSLSLVQ